MAQKSRLTNPADVTTATRARFLQRLGFRTMDRVMAGLTHPRIQPPISHPALDDLRSELGLEIEEWDEYSRIQKLERLATGLLAEDRIQQAEEHGVGGPAEALRPPGRVGGRMGMGRGGSGPARAVASGAPGGQRSRGGA